jgi:hypothetical protein
MAVPGAGYHLAELVAADLIKVRWSPCNRKAIREQPKRVVFCSVNTDVFDNKATRERIWRPSGRTNPPPVRSDGGNSTG